MISGRWLRIAPDDSSMPLQTMSYWIALMPRIVVLVVGVERQELVVRVVRHRERVVREVDLLLLLVPLVHREVDDPAEREAVLVDEPELRPIRWRAAPAKAVNFAGTPQTKKTASPSFSFNSLRIVSGALRPDVLGDRPGALPVVAEEDVAEAGLALALRP